MIFEISPGSENGKAVNAGVMSCEPSVSACVLLKIHPKSNFSSAVNSIEILRNNAMIHLLTCNFRGYSTAQTDIELYPLALIYASRILVFILSQREESLFPNPKTTIPMVVTSLQLIFDLSW